MVPVFEPSFRLASCMVWLDNTANLALKKSISLSNQWEGVGARRCLKKESNLLDAYSGVAYCDSHTTTANPIRATAFVAADCTARHRGTSGAQRPLTARNGPLCA